MLTNPKKSGIMVFRSSELDDVQENNILGYPIVSSYKYLGMTVAKDLRLRQHVEVIQHKINFIKHRLSPIRFRKNTKMNLNLFKIFVLPLYRLDFTNY